MIQGHIVALERLELRPHVAGVGLGQTSRSDLLVANRRLVCHLITSSRRVQESFNATFGEKVTEEAQASLGVTVTCFIGGYYTAAPCFGRFLKKPFLRERNIKSVNKFLKTTLVHI